MMRTRQPAHRQSRGFTLVELLVVTGIIALLLALIVPAVTSLNKSRALNGAGGLLVNLLSTARAEAITRRTVVRLEVATAWPSDPACNYRKVTLTTAVLVGNVYNYQQLGKWETLPEGVVFETSDPPRDPPLQDGSVYFLSTDTNTPLGDAGQLSFGGKPISTVYVAFSPTGALVEKQPPTNLPVPICMRLVEGTADATGTVTYTHRAKGGPGIYPTANWFDIRINHLFGRVEVGRPEAPLP